MMKKEIRASASTLKTLKDCSLLFYYEKILNYPSKQWTRTTQGSMIHSIFELIMEKRRLKTLKKIIEKGFTFERFPSIKRYVEIYAYHHDISPYIMEEIESMIDVAFLGIRPYFMDDKGKFAPPETYFNEWAFEFKIGDATLKGFIDLLIVYPKYSIIIDLKSQKNKFTKAELPNNLQALFYNLAVRTKLGVKGVTNFILLRHPPTKRTADMHIQSVKEPSDGQLNGVSEFIQSQHYKINNFTLEDAMAAPHKDSFFCSRVCTQYAPHQIRSIVKKDSGVLVKNYLMDQKFTCAEDEKEVIIEHKGCAHAWKH